MASSLLKLENIRIIDKVDDWKSAIHASLELLEQGMYITANYEKAVLRCTEKYGPYYVLCDDLALVHARPEDGVITGQLAVTILREPVVFPNDDRKVRILIALCAEDADSHLEIMQAIVLILMDEAKLQALAHAKDPQSVYDMLSSAEKAVQATSQ